MSINHLAEWPLRRVLMVVAIASTILMFSCDPDEDQAEKEAIAFVKGMDSLITTYPTVVTNSVEDSNEAFDIFWRRNKLPQELVFRDSIGRLTGIDFEATTALLLKTNSDSPELLELSNKIVTLAEHSSDVTNFLEGLDALRKQAKNGQERKLIRQNKKIFESLSDKSTKKCDSGWWKCWGVCAVKIVAAAGAAGVAAASGGTTVVAYAAIFGGMSGLLSCNKEN
jgi:hypothetical protein